MRHDYRVIVRWSGRTADYRSYSRDHLIEADGHAAIPGSSDPAFRGSPDRWNPEELLLASLSACHKLWFLHLAAEAGLVVTGYVDRAEGVMIDDAQGGTFESVTLRPEVTLDGGGEEKLAAVHHAAHARCTIARAVKFGVQIAAS